MTEVARITIKLDQVRDGYKVASDNPLASLIERAVEGLDEETKARIAASGECTVVYHGCGTCENGGALVEYFCSGGGSQPDFTRCESCD